MFENEYILNKKLITEYVFCIASKRIIITGVLLFITGLVMYYTQINNMRQVMLTCSFMGIVSAILTPILYIYNYEEAEKRLNNGVIKKTRVLFDDKIVLNEGTAHLEFEYSQIVKITKTKSFLFLELGNKSGILVLKEGFVKGDLDSFLEFIKEKTKKKKDI